MHATTCIINAIILNSTSTIHEPEVKQWTQAEPSPVTHNLVLLPLSTLLAPRPYPSVAEPIAVYRDFGTIFWNTCDLLISPPWKMYPSSAGNGFVQYLTSLPTDSFPSTSNPTPSTSDFPGTRTGPSIGTSLPPSPSPALTSSPTVSSPSPVLRLPLGSRFPSLILNAIPLTTSHDFSDNHASAFVVFVVFIVHVYSDVRSPLSNSFDDAVILVLSPTSTSTSPSPSHPMSSSPLDTHTSVAPTSTSLKVTTSSRNTNTVVPESTTFFAWTTGLTTVTPSSSSHAQSPPISTAYNHPYDIIHHLKWVAEYG
ncbi:hypothetical protein BU15DRAFT_74034 [Melanogaster broomeanus]|nr:hypothetical protein BU15DRAFT_74034 [Melanogaster broomeanus]